MAKCKALTGSVVKGLILKTVADSKARCTAVSVRNVNVCEKIMSTFCAILRANTGVLNHTSVVFCNNIWPLVHCATD